MKWSTPLDSDSPVGSIFFQYPHLMWTMGLQRISGVCSPVSRNHKQPRLNWAEHLNAILPSLQGGDKLAAEMGLFLLGRGNRSRNPPYGGYGFASQPSSSSGLNCTPPTVCSYLVAGKFIYISACTSILSALLWIDHNTVEIFDGIFWLQKRFTATSNSPVIEQAGSLLLSSSSECKWKALQNLCNAHRSEAQDVLAYTVGKTPLDWLLQQNRSDYL